MLPPGEEGRFEDLGESGFQFACHPGVPCFNECCRRLTLVLTPYDALRLRQRLGLGSAEFIDQYTVVESGQNGWPIPRLAMSETAEGTCPFLSEAGCTVYEDRPAACRMYPMGRATKGGQRALEESFFLVREPHCQGFEAGPQWTPAQWMADQGLEPYNATNDLFMPLVTRQAPAASSAEAQKKMQMFFMACYNTDAFRRFVLDSGLGQRLGLPRARLELMADNDLQLLKFAFDWLAFALFGDPTLTPPQPAAPSG